MKKSKPAYPRTPEEFSNYIRSQLSYGIECDVDSNILVVPSNIESVSDEKLNELYFSAQSFAAKLGVDLAHADIEKQFAENRKERAYSRMLLQSDEPSSEDRKADALESSLHTMYNRVYLEKLAIFKELLSLKLAYERMAETYSRIMTRRKTAWEQETIN